MVIVVCNVKRKERSDEMEACISVIVPVYQAEQRLEDFFLRLPKDASVLEWIFVDDGSTDGTKELLYRMRKQIREQDIIQAEIRILHLKKNSGPGIARNEGIHCAKGSCIAFLDVDDWVEEGYYTEQLKAMRKNGVDVVVSEYVQDTYQKNGKKTGSHPVKADIGYRTKEEDEIAFLDYRKLFSYCFNKLYLRDLITENGILFPEGKMNEDFFFNCAVFLYSEGFCVQTEKRYHYRKEKNQGLTGAYLPDYPELIERRYQAFRELMKRKGRPKASWEKSVSAVHIKHVFSAFVRLYDKRGKLSGRKRREIAGRLLAMPSVKSCARRMRRDSFAAKVLAILFFCPNKTVLLSAGRAAFLLQNYGSALFDRMKR